MSGPPGARYAAVTPKRLLDTRTTIGGHHARLGVGGTATIAVPGLPGTATAVVVNLTGVKASTTTYLTAYASGTAAPATSNLNLSVTDPTAAVLAIVRLPSTHKIIVRNNAGSTDVVVDELGYFDTGPATGRYTALAAPKRVLDTRTTVGGHHATLGNRGAVRVTPGVPADATAAIVNVTVANSASTGFLSAAAGCTASSSTLNYTKYVRANLAVVQLSGTTRGFCVENIGPAVNVIVDVVGYMAPTGAEYFALPAAQRIVDTRTGNGGSAGGHAFRALGTNTTTAFYGANVGDVPGDATALFTGVAEASSTALSYLTLFPGSTKPASTTSNLNFTTGRIVPNAALVGLKSQVFGMYNNAGSTHAVVDLFGYFRTVPG